VAVGTAITLLFVPALYALWFRLPRVSPVRPDQVTEAGVAQFADPDQLPMPDRDGP
jgi:hypothetical protein